MKHIQESTSRLEENTGPTREEALRAIEAALLCLDEGNVQRAAQLLYSALPKDRRPNR